MKDKDMERIWSMIFLTACLVSDEQMELLISPLTEADRLRLAERIEKTRQP